jgi:hypothetical protein
MFKKICVFISIILLSSITLTAAEKSSMIFRPEGKTLVYNMSVEMEVNFKEGFLDKTLYKEVISGGLILSSGIQFGGDTPCLVKVENLNLNQEIKEINLTLENLTLDEQGQISSIGHHDGREVINGIPFRDILSNIFPKFGGQKSSWNKTGELTYYAPAFDKIPAMKLRVKLNNKYNKLTSTSAEISGYINLEGKPYNSDKVALSGKSKEVKGHMEFSNGGYFTFYEVEYKVETKEFPLEVTLRVSLTL